MQHENHSSRRSNITLLFLLALSISFLSTSTGFYIRALKDFVFYVAYPIPVMATMAIESSHGVFDTLSEIVRIHQENENLRRENNRLLQVENEYLRFRAENERLSAIVGFKPPVHMTPVAARVTGREPSGWFQWIIVDRGKSDGIFIDAPVISVYKNRSCALGRVAELYSRSAKVVLITNAVSALPCSVSSGGGDGLLEGRDAPLLKLNYVLPDSLIKIGDEIVTSPLSTVFPPGMLVGSVLDTSRPANDVYYSATVKPAVKLDDIREVMILIPDKNFQRYERAATAVSAPRAAPVRASAPEAQQ